MKRWGIAWVLAVGVFAAARPAGAFSTGFVGNCMSCHSGGATPQVTLTPAMTCLAPGATTSVDVTITSINGGPGGLDLSILSGGGFFSIGGSASALTQISGGDVTHTAPKLGSGGLVRFSANYTASPTAGTATLRAYGLSANGNASTTGDGTGQTIVPIMIAAPVTCAVGSCGTLTNACGQAVSCGVCSGGNTCANNVCVAAPSVPASNGGTRVLLAALLLAAGALPLARRAFKRAQSQV
ncbi:MAG TPA: choice-of-anchor V domain-containing protein [Polyangia bacterium]|nr:choice-of-anchor V domain-containing protein [Polyangia bacterium]